MSPVDLRKLKAPPRPWFQQRLCSNELKAFESCMAEHGYNNVTMLKKREPACADVIRALDRCFEESIKPLRQKKHKVTTNYHLQRLAKAIQRGKGR